MPSGKQVLLHLLQKYSLTFQEKAQLPETSEDLRVGFLLHGSTPPAMWHHVENIEWGNETREDGRIARQGLKVKGKDILLSDLFQEITWEDSVIPQRVQERFPDLTSEEYQSSTHLIWLLLKALEYADGLSQVEDGGKLDMQQMAKSLASYRKKLKLFREDPADFLG